MKDNINIKQEATLSKDTEKYSKSKNIVNYINQQINSYKNNNIIKYTKENGYNEVQIKFKNLLVYFKDIPSREGSSAEFSPGSNKNKPTINVYNCTINIQPKLSVSYNESSLIHELVHSFDFENIQNPEGALHKAEKAGLNRDYSEYVNSAIEFNAHFFHLVMPVILAYLEDLDELPQNFNEFKNNILYIDEIKKFYDYLNKNNQQRFMKRLGSYWVSIKNNDTNVQNGSIDDLKLKDRTQTWVKKVKNMLNLSESQIFISNTNNMKVKDLKKAVKNIVLEVKKTKKQPDKKTKPKKKEKLEERDEVGQFYMVGMPNKNSTLEEIIITSTLREFASKPNDMGKIVGVYKNEVSARKLAEELIDHRTSVLSELKEEEIQKKMNEIQGTKAMVGATQEYFKLKPSLNEDESNKKLEELNGNLTKLEEDLNKLKEEKTGIEENYTKNSKNKSTKNNIKKPLKENRDPKLEYYINGIKKGIEELKKIAKDEGLIQ